jgi:hypothetical protein
MTIDNEVIKAVKAIYSALHHRTRGLAASQVQPIEDVFKQSVKSSVNPVYPRVIHKNINKGNIVIFDVGNSKKSFRAYIQCFSAYNCERGDAFGILSSQLFAALNFGNVYMQ